MKRHDKSLVRMMTWAGEARREPPEFALSPGTRRHLLALWRQHAAERISDGVSWLLKLALGGSTAIVIVSILLNLDLIRSDRHSPSMAAPEDVFEPRTFVTFYIP